jgi:hypothetical protein
MPIDETLARASKIPAKRPITLGQGGRARLSSDVSLVAGMKLDGATVKLDRLLFEAGGHGELTHPRGTQTARTITLRPAGRGRFAGTARGARLTVVRAHGRARMTLDVRMPSTRAPRACVGLPASVRLDGDPLTLESRLSISSGQVRQRVRMTHDLECRRDRAGNVDRLVRAKPTPAAKPRPGLSLRVSGPKQASPGSTVRLKARVANRRRTSLWGVVVGTKRIGELPAGRARTVTLTRRLPADLEPGRFCTWVVAYAPGADGKQARACFRIQR